MFILKELYVVSQKQRKKKKSTLCMESYACDTEWVQSSIIPLNLNVGIHVYGLVAIVVGMDGVKKHQRFTKKKKKQK